MIGGVNAGCEDAQVISPIKTAKELISSMEEMHDAKKESIVIESCEVAAGASRENGP